MFRLAATCTNSAFVFKRNYLTYLYDYEIVKLWGRPPTGKYVNRDGTGELDVKREKRLSHRGDSMEEDDESLAASRFSSRRRASSASVGKLMAFQGLGYFVSQESLRAL